MANFLQQSKSPFGQMNLYQPDWSFLTTIMGTRQAEYDRGFKAVRSLYSSELNAPLTNQENEAYRQDTFRRIEESLRNTASLDLSNASNIDHAMSLIDPISKDPELAYDKAVTAFHSREKQRMNQYKNSTDPELRKLYSDVAEQYINIAEIDLSSAKRGDGSILQVKPHEFVPFEDYMSFLNKQASDMKLEIVQSTPGGGYILKRTNGAIQEYDQNGKPISVTTPIFSDWAQAQMGTRFDRQFQVMGEVQAETAIRTKMQEQNISRQQAIQLVSSDLKLGLAQKQVEKHVQSVTELDQVNDKIALYKKLYVGGFPKNKPELVEEYKELLTRKNELEKQKENTVREATKLQSPDGDQYVAANLYSFFGQGAKETAALMWGSTYANATAKQDISPDQTYLTNLRLAQADRHFKMNYNLKIKELEMNQANVDRKYALDYQIAQKKGEVPSSTITGYTTSSADISAADILQDDFIKTKNNLFNTVFNLKDGLINLAINDTDKRNQFYLAMNRLHESSQGGPVTMRKGDMEILQSTARMLGMGTISTPKSAADAADLEAAFIGGTYIQATGIVSEYARLGKTKEIKNIIPNFENTLANVSLYINASDKQAESMRRISGEISKNPENYEGARIIGRYQDGTPIYDITGLDMETKRSLNMLVDPEYNKRTRPVTYVTQHTGLGIGNLTVLSDQLYTDIDYSDEKIKDFVSGASPADMLDAFGAAAKVVPDPITKTADITFQITSTSKTASAHKLSGGSVTVTVPFSAIMSSPAPDMIGWQQTIQQSQINPYTAGKLSTFNVNPYARVTSDSYLDALGLKYSLTGTTDAQGNYGVLLNVQGKDPATNTYKEANRFLAVDFQNPNTFYTLSEILNELQTNYQLGVAGYELNQEALDEYEDY